MIFLNKLEGIRSRAQEIEAQLSDPSVIKDQQLFQKLSKELAAIRPIVETFESYSKVNTEITEIKKTLAEDELDDEMTSLYEEEVKQLSEKEESLAQSLEDLVLRETDPLSHRDVIIEIRAGTGGEEAGLFAADLYRMYTRYATELGLKSEVLQLNETGIGGYKEVIFSVTGVSVYSYFKYESGIHRVQRVPSTESGGRIHTSAVTVAVLPEVDAQEFDIDPTDLKIDVFRASGAGGQHVNKTESAVRITHIPTGVVVSCQDERSQHKNKAKAMRVLRARIFDAQQQKQHDELAKQRKDQVGSGDRSGKIRTYNFPDQRVTDHRIGLTLHSLNDILDGHLDELVQGMAQDEKTRKLKDLSW